ncbi:MAG: sugar ABC transporter ATP-binding protein [Desulfotomaculum sp.]|nr:sugar ABC transporter ATP-binding protein [Desulfotomaculum sp.]
MTLLQMKGISKSFPGAKVLDGVNLEVKQGEIHALLGENGAGKSTLMKILTGIHQKDAGEIIYDGKKITPTNPKEAENLGIVMIHQEFNLVPYISAAENIYLGAEEAFSKMGIVNWKALYNSADKYLQQVGLNIYPGTKVADLNVGEKQLVEIAKALSRRTRLLIMDEPTAALTERETKRLFEIIKNLSANGVAIIYISHRMEELFAVCHRVTVLRDGKYIATKEIAETNIDELVSLMVGRQLSERFPKKPAEIGEVILQVKNFRNKYLHDVSIEVRAGEVVGLAGLMGAGRSELVRAIFGADPVEGKLVFGDFSGTFKHPSEAIKKGIAMVPEDRKDQGLILSFSVRHNLALPTLHKRAVMGNINYRQEKEMTRRQVEKLKIKLATPEQEAKSLSGGNQQKVVFGKWLEAEPKLFILDEPTRGVDVGAKVEIYNLINKLTSRGIGVLLVSSDLEELMGMSDRVYVMYEGKITGHFKRDEMSDEAIMYCATGGSK